MAAIECKTQLGCLNRNNWIHSFDEREHRLSLEFPGAKLFQLVMTGSNWHGFGDDKRAGTQFFVLLKDIWPEKFESSEASNYIVNPIEKLLIEVLSHAKG